MLGNSRRPANNSATSFINPKSRNGSSRGVALTNEARRHRHLPYPRRYKHIREMDAFYQVKNGRLPKFYWQFESRRHKLHSESEYRAKRSK